MVGAEKVVKVGPWELGELLGRGSTATVWRCRHEETGGVYACKMVCKAALKTEGDVQRIQREINTMAFLRHENLLALHDFLFDEDNLYLILDYANGGELFDFISEQGKLAEPDAALIFVQIANAVSYAHSYGVAHRDLKLENILIDKYPHVKVADFGLCGFLSDYQLMRTFCGSPIYCAPESICRVQYDGRKSDVWSMGVILYTMVTGKHPWSVANTACMLRQIVRGSYRVPDHVSQQCRDLVQHCLHVDPGQRFTVADVLGHPWLELAQRSRVARPPGFRLQVPRVAEMAAVTLEELSEASARAASVKDQGSGIVSPFVRGTPDRDSTSSLPLLVVRSASVERLRLRERDTGSKRGESLSGVRQKSQVNLVQEKGARRNRQFTTIGEE